MNATRNTLISRSGNVGERKPGAGKAGRAKAIKDPPTHTGGKGSYHLHPTGIPNNIECSPKPITLANLREKIKQKIGSKKGKGFTKETYCLPCFYRQFSRLRFPLHSNDPFGK